MRTCSVVPLRYAVSGALALAVGFSACGDGDGTARAMKPARAQTSAAALPKGLAGTTWTRTFTKREEAIWAGPTGRHVLKIRNGEIDVFEGPDTDPTTDCITQSECESIELMG